MILLILWILCFIRSHACMCMYNLYENVSPIIFLIKKRESESMHTNQVKDNHTTAVYADVARNASGVAIGSQQNWTCLLSWTPCGPR